MEFSIGIEKFLLIFVLCLASQSYVEAEKKVTVNSFDSNVPANEIVEFWNYDLADSRISSSIKIKQNCPGVVTADIKIFQGHTMVQAVNKQFTQPLKDFKDFNMCESMDYPESDDDSCSVVEGEQSAIGCDISSWFSDMDSGDYGIECDFKLQNLVLTSLKLGITITDE